MTDPNKRFTELAKVAVHSWETRGIDGKTYTHTQPDFSDPREVLKVIMEREDWPSFCERVGWYVERDGGSLINLQYITTPGLLRDRWIEWRESCGQS